MSNVNGTFAATGQSSTVEGTDVDLLVGGTFVATLQLQVSIPSAAGADTWVSMGQLTAAGSVVMHNAIGRKFRVACTAYTSGTVLYSLGSAMNDDMRSV